MERQLRFGVSSKRSDELANRAAMAARRMLQKNTPTGVTSRRLWGALRQEGQGTLRVRCALAAEELPQEVVEDLTGYFHDVLVSGDGQLGGRAIFFL